MTGFVKLDYVGVRCLVGGSSSVGTTNKMRSLLDNNNGLEGARFTMNIPLSESKRVNDEEVGSVFNVESSSGAYISMFHGNVMSGLVKVVTAYTMKMNGFLV